jgi:hypothetical protein
MKNYTFTQDQLEEYSNLIQGLMDYQGTHDSPPEYEEWLEKTFGEDWLDYQIEGDGNLYECEFDFEFYYGLVVGQFSQGIKDWIESEKEGIKEWKEQQVEDEDEEEN